MKRKQNKIVIWNKIKINNKIKNVLEKHPLETSFGGENFQ